MKRITSGANLNDSGSKALHPGHGMLTQLPAYLGAPVPWRHGKDADLAMLPGCVYLPADEPCHGALNFADVHVPRKGLERGQR